jgi:hypothetical protein
MCWWPAAAREAWPPRSLQPELERVPRSWIPTAASAAIFPEFIDGYGILIIPTTGRYLHVPYRSLVPKGIGNLLVTGRSIGGDRVSHAAVRNMMCCAVSGQGAGGAAAVSLRTGQPFDRLDIEALQTELRRQGARIQ